MEVVYYYYRTVGLAVGREKQQQPTLALLVARTNIKHISGWIIAVRKAEAMRDEVKAQAANVVAALVLACIIAAVLVEAQSPKATAQVLAKTSFRGDKGHICMHEHADGSKIIVKRSPKIISCD
jgi:hypothetical protein